MNPDPKLSDTLMRKKSFRTFNTAKRKEKINMKIVFKKLSVLSVDTYVGIYCYVRCEFAGANVDSALEKNLTFEENVGRLTRPVYFNNK
jgi:hypothetical protein